MRQSFVVGFLSLVVAAGCESPSKDAVSVPAAASQVAPAASVASVPASAYVAPSASVQPVTPADTIIAQHVLVIYKGAKRAPKSVGRSKLDAKARAGEALAKIQAGASFEDVVRQYSDDSGSVDRMGSLGKFRRGDMDPAFSAAAFALRPGQVSDVVETPFGFHVIKRTQ